ncbi:MAG: polysaccharide pyruvyl transferase family protein [Paludibacteraceae bacterium]|nr:polysaccharide pyruvyl transferase family protein [Paludibacteraceae bacterium]
MSLKLPDIERCFCCGACVDACAHSAISLTEDVNGFYCPSVNAQLCVDCGLCERACPSLHSASIDRNDFLSADVYAAWGEDEALIAHSASGGVFAQVAYEFLQQPNRIVFGASLDEHSRVSHVGVEDVSDLVRLQNSKYQQSDATGVYREVRHALSLKKEVLFSGTPCQVAGLYRFLGGVKPGLYTMEVVCHGVPSNYLAQLSLRLHNARRIVSYRTKSLGWARGNRTTYGLKNGDVLEIERYRKDFHFRSYLSFLWLRRSCRSCPFAQVNRVADISMGDFWGCDVRKYNNPMGVSVLLVNNERGKFLVEATKHLYKKRTTWREVLAHNQNIYMPTRQGSMLANQVGRIKSLPLGVQKAIFQQGFTNKWLFGAGQVVGVVCDKFFGVGLRTKMRRERQRIQSSSDAYRQKVGILTTYFAANFGAMLQPYALKRVLELAGYDVDFIRYKQKAVYESHRAWSMSRLFGSGWRNMIGNVLALPFSLIQDHKMQRFKRQYLEVDDAFETSISVDKDFYLFGSDQIWNPRNTGGFDSVYFGDFTVKAGAKKIAYAASGERIDDTEENRAYLRAKLANFDAIAVREGSLRIKLEMMTGVRGIDVVLDPTLLAPRSILDELPGRSVMGNERYVFFYQLRQSVAFLQKIHRYARSRGCKLLVVSASPKKECILYSLRHADVTYLPTAGMEEFLGGIRHAECVFSPSFHGSVFAIIYNKPLFSISLGDGLDTRTRDLLVELGMEGRIVSLDTDLATVPDVSYDEVNKKVEALRQHSMDFLTQNMI